MKKVIALSLLFSVATTIFAPNVPPAAPAGGNVLQLAGAVFTFLIIVGAGGGYVGYRVYNNYTRYCLEAFEYEKKLASLKDETLKLEQQRQDLLNERLEQSFLEYSKQIGKLFIKSDKFLELTEKLRKYDCDDDSIFRDSEKCRKIEEKLNVITQDIDFDAQKIEEKFKTHLNRKSEA